MGTESRHHHSKHEVFLARRAATENGCDRFGTAGNKYAQQAISGNGFNSYGLGSDTGTGKASGSSSRAGTCFGTQSCSGEGGSRARESCSGSSEDAFGTSTRKGCAGRNEDSSGASEGNSACPGA